MAVHSAQAKPTKKIGTSKRRAAHLTAKIIDLAEYRSSGVRCEEFDLPFPTVYRLTGVSWSESDNGDLVPGDIPYTEYTLSDEPTSHLANIKFEAITKLDPSIDKGWVIVRHHRTREHVDGYLNGQYDSEPDRERFGRMVWQTKAGIFSITNRPAIHSCRDHLLVYACDIPHPKFTWEHWEAVFSADGATYNAMDAALYPPEPD